MMGPARMGVNQAVAMKIDKTAYGRPAKTTLQNTESIDERGFDNLDRRASLAQYGKEPFPSYKLNSRFPL